MTGKLGDQGLDTLERRFQALRDQIGAMPEACRPELEGALQSLSQAIAAVRQGLEAGGSPRPDPPGCQEVQRGPTAEIRSPMSPEAWPSPCEAMLRHVFNAIPDLLTVHDRDFNTIMSNWHGYELAPEAERRGQPKCYRVYHHRDRPCDDCHVLEVLATGQPVKVTKVNPVDGRVREVSAYPVRDESGRVVLVVEHVRDITDRHLAAEALRASEERFRMLFEYAPDSYILADMQGEIIDCNKATEDLTGYGREELIGNNFACLPIMDLQQQTKLMELLAQAALGKVLGPVDFTLTRKDGREVIAEGMSLPLHIQGQNLVLAIARDITARKRAEEELFKKHLELQETAQRLEQSRNMLHLIIESIPVRVFWKDSDLRFLGCNTLFALDAGLNDPQQLLGQDDFAMGWREQAHLYRMDDRQVMESLRPKMNMIEPQTTPAGAKIWLKTSKVPLQMPNGEVFGVLGVYEDITTHKQAEEALQESEARFRHISSTISDISYSCSTGPDGSYVIDWLAGAAERITGYSVEEIQAQGCWGFLVIEADQPLFEKHITGLAVGSSGNCELRLRHKNGGIVWIASFAKIVQEPDLLHIYGGLVDISARKRAEEALRESEARFRAVFEYALVGICISDLGGQVLQTNQALQGLLGYSADEFRDMSIQEITHPEDLTGNLQLQEELLAGKRQHYSTEKRCLRKDGGIVWAQVMMTLLRDGRGEPRYLLATVVDRTARKQAEAELRQSEQRFRDIIENAAEWVWEVDSQGKYTYSSPVVEQLLGYKPEEILGKYFYDFFLPDEREELKNAALAAFAAKQPFRDFLNPNLHKDGRTVQLSTSGIPILDEQGNLLGYRGADIDITARKRAEEDLAAHLQFLQLLLDTIPNPIFFKDAQGAYLGCNKAFEDFLGVTRQEIVGKSVYDLSPKELADEYHRMDLEAFQTTGTQVYESRVRAADGARRHVVFHKATFPDPTGGLGGLVGIITDITALKQAEAELRESEQRFRLMAETIQDVFWIATPGIGKMVYVSPGYEQVWGRTCQELYQFPLSFIDAIHPEDRERVKSAITAARAQGIPWSHEYRITQPDGAGRWIKDRGFPVRDDQGRVILFTGVATDITEHKVLEGQLLQAQKMEAVGRLAGGIAHDFNNLLMAITGYGELMRSKVFKDDPLYSHLENILKAGDRATALTQQLLTFSRQKIIHPEVIDLNRVVLDLEPMLRRLIGEDLDLEVVTDRRLGAVKADPGQMGQIIMNLMVNARDAMPQGGRLTLKTAPVNFTAGCHSRFGLTPPGAYVMLVVQDTGVGMDEATQSHVFEPFFTTKEPGKGTGLGLSTVYGIVKQSGGYLDLASAPGAGSTFTIFLPRLEAIIEPPKTKIPITASFRGEETILLVEDEDVLRGLLAKFLRIYGYTVLEARHGGEALLTCERHQGPIHLMVTDVVMPQMSGRELADRLTPLRPEMKVLYMSGYTEDALVQHGVTDLSVAFLQKPFRPIELARRAHAVLHPPVGQ